MTYDPAGAPFDSPRGDELVSTATGTELVTPFSAPQAPQPARPVTRRSSLPAPVRAAAVGGAGIATGLLIAAVLPRRNKSRVIVAPGLSRKKRKLRTRQTTSLLVDLHLLDR